MSGAETLLHLSESIAMLRDVANQEGVVAEREVRVHRVSIDYILSSESALVGTDMATECEEGLQKLEESVREKKESHTGDTDNVKLLGFMDDGVSMLVKLERELEKKKGPAAIQAHATVNTSDEEGQTAAQGASNGRNRTSKDRTEQQQSSSICTKETYATSTNTCHQQIAEDCLEDTNIAAMDQHEEGDNSERIIDIKGTPVSQSLHISTNDRNNNMNDNTKQKKKNKNTSNDIDKQEESGDEGINDENNNKEKINHASDGGKRNNSEAREDTPRTAPRTPPSTPSKKEPAWKFIDIPRRRRLQTLAISSMLFFTMTPMCILMTVILMCNPNTLPFMIIYWIWIIFIFPRWYPHPLEPQMWWRNSSIFKHVRDYFPCRLMIPGKYRSKFDNKRNYLFVYHPHGVHSFGAMLTYGTNPQNIEQYLPGLKFHLQTLPINFYVPFWREISIWCGCGNASAKTITDTLRSGPGRCVVLVVGGAEESLLSSPKTNILCLKKRKGFVKLALRTGSPLVPSYGFGETNVYYNLAEGAETVRKILIKIQKKLGFALPLFSGRGYFNYDWGVLPHRRPIVVVVGPPMEVPMIAEPTQADIDEWHGRYVAALKDLYNTHKGVYDVNGALEIC